MISVFDRDELWRNKGGDAWHEQEYDYPYNKQHPGRNADYAILFRLVETKICNEEKSQGKNEIGALVGYVSCICKGIPIVLLDGKRDSDYIDSYIAKYSIIYVNPKNITIINIE